MVEGLKSSDEGCSRYNIEKEGFGKVGRVTRIQK